MSSGGERALDFRPPLDVVNMSRLFGLTDIQCKAAITSVSRAALLHSSETPPAGMYRGFLTLCVCVCVCMCRDEEAFGKSCGQLSPTTSREEKEGEGRRQSDFSQKISEKIIDYVLTITHCVSIISYNVLKTNKQKK